MARERKTVRLTVLVTPTMARELSAQVTTDESASDVVRAAIRAELVRRSPSAAPSGIQWKPLRDSRGEPYAYAPRSEPDAGRFMIFELPHTADGRPYLLRVQQPLPDRPGLARTFLLRYESLDAAQAGAEHLRGPFAARTEPLP